MKRVRIMRVPAWKRFLLILGKPILFFMPRFVRRIFERVSYFLFGKPRGGADCRKKFVRSGGLFN